MKKPIIALLSDFGTKDPYVAEMKGVILNICPEAEIVDITHEIEKFNVKTGAFILASASRYFPENTIYVAVVDPGVGTERRAIIVQTAKALLVGPDNGLLMLAAQNQEIKKVYEIRNSSYTLPKISRTFHGRDIFAPAAAYLAKGINPEEFGPEVTDYIIPKYGKPIVEEKSVKGEILHVDGFGNLITNISKEILERIRIKEGDLLKVYFKDKVFKFRLCGAYGEVAKDEALAIIGSHDFLEFSVNLGNASKFFGLKVGDEFELEFLILNFVRFS